jgi:hypothetical protein
MAAAPHERRLNGLFMDLRFEESAVALWEAFRSTSSRRRRCGRVAADDAQRIDAAGLRFEQAPLNLACRFVPQDPRQLLKIDRQTMPLRLATGTLSTREGFVGAFAIERRSRASCRPNGLPKQSVACVVR